MLLCTLCGFVTAEARTRRLDARTGRLLAELEACPFKIIYESYRGTSWDLMIMNADGSHPVNLTRTRNTDELYPHASPDGTKVVFVADRGKWTRRTRDVYYMNIDGTGRVRAGRNGRQPFWSPDGRVIAYAIGTGRTSTVGGYDNRELHFYDIQTESHSRHPKRDIARLLNPCWSPDGKWIITSVIHSMSSGTISAIELEGRRVVELAKTHWERGRRCKNVYQCRPDISPDGRHVAWTKDDVDNRLGFGRRSMWMEVADIDLAAAGLPLSNYRHPVRLKHPQETYHVDWSPDSRYIAFSQGPRGRGRMGLARFVIGNKASGWDIHVVDPSAPDVVVQLTHDGLSNKEPDWVFAAPAETGSSR